MSPAASSAILAFEPHRFPKVLCWVAGGPGVGMGHVMRSLTLARGMTVAGFRVAGFVSNADAHSCEAIVAAGWRCWEETVAEISTCVDLLLVDRPAGVDQRVARWLDNNPKVRVVALDSFDMEAQRADVVINLINHHPQLSRPVSTRVSYHEGVEFAIIRPEFLALRQERPVPPVASELLITFGGADPRNHSALALAALGKTIARTRRIRLVVGPGFLQADALSGSAAAAGVEIIRGTTNLAPIFSTADLALCGGGTTMLELACCGVPMAVLPQTDAEARFASSFAEKGAAVLLDRDASLDQLHGAIEGLANDAEARTKLGARARELVDGRGQERIIELLRHTHASHLC